MQFHISNTNYQVHKNHHHQSKNDAVLDGGQINASTIGIAAMTPELAELNFVMSSNPEAASK